MLLLHYKMEEVGFEIGLSNLLFFKMRDSKVHLPLMDEFSRVSWLTSVLWASYNQETRVCPLLSFPIARRLRAWAPPGQYWTGLLVPISSILIYKVYKQIILFAYSSSSSSLTQTLLFVASSRLFRSFFKYCVVGLSAAVAVFCNSEYRLTGIYGLLHEPKFTVYLNKGLGWGAVRPEEFLKWSFGAVMAPLIH